MDTDHFWTVIESARSSAESNGKTFADALVDRLAAFSREEILAYQERFDEVHDALYRWDVWAAAYLIGGGCSDDSFMDFRAGLIALGRDWYERAAASPDALAAHPAVRAAATATDRDDRLFYEDVNYAAGDAFSRLTGDREDFYEAWDQHRSAPAPSDETEPETEPESESDMGEDFDFDDAGEMRRRLPALADLYLGKV
ncbi:DUF4240 domain-containing protein [Streptomyces albicerus]|uniref:DUF4240 domain-containing protein n=1 Tax=Streptomyces albicerus TaxID=2569859 RepID=UPI00124B88A1|nr:DUF4240 domain-containing protein [Streptomyces albicerus]